MVIRQQHHLVYFAIGLFIIAEELLVTSSNHKVTLLDLYMVMEPYILVLDLFDQVQTA